MHISRRAVLRNSVVAFGVLALAACTQQQVASAITVAQQDLTDGLSVVAAVQTAFGVSIPSAVQGYISEAENALNALSPGQAVAATSVSGILADLSSAVNAGLKALPGNAYLSDAQIVLAALSAAWSIAGAVMVKSAVNPAELAAARAHLAALKAK
jgi:hypothetical protein